MDKYDSVIAIIESSDVEEVVNLWNEFAVDNGFEDDMIYPNDDANIDEVFNSASEFARSATYGDYMFQDSYFCFNGYGNIVTFNYLNDDNCPIDLDELTDYLIENGDSTFDVDSDELENDFLEEYFPNEDDCDKAREIADNLAETEPIDFLMDDWDNLAETIKSHWDD